MTVIIKPQISSLNCFSLQLYTESKTFVKLISKMVRIPVISSLSLLQVHIISWETDWLLSDLKATKAMLQVGVRLRSPVSVTVLPVLKYCLLSNVFFKHVIQISLKRHVTIFFKNH